MHTNISFELHTKIQQKVKECLARYGLDTTPVEIVYKDMGRVAGTASYYPHFKITLSPTLLLANVEDFIARTVVHETAHIIHKIKYPNDHIGRRSIHGSNWKRVMLVLGGPTTRCHTYDTTIVPGVRARDYKYTCGCVGKVFNLTKIIHNKILNGQHRHCLKCKATIKETV